LVNDVENNIYLVNILKINEENLSKNSDKFKNFDDQGMMKLRDQMYSTYDNFINDKYKVKINQKTLERVKNYFK
jgi:peptidyl-prolyl cis-trans isomerase D